MAAEEWIFGLHSVQAVLKSQPQRVQELRVAGGRRDRRLQKVLDLARTADIAVTPASRDELDQLVSGNHQGVAALCRAGAVPDEHHLFALLEQTQGAPLLLVLDGVTDPHNLGACLRSADAAGVLAVVVPKDKAAGLTPTVRKVASGAAETVPLIPVTNLARTLDQLKAAGVWLVGMAGEADSDLYAADLKGPLALVLGAEGKGLRRLTREACDLLVHIPMAGSVDSLNVSVATGICLFEAVRQRRH